MSYLRAGGLCPPVHLLLATSWIPSHAFRFLEARIWVVAAASSREARGSPAPVMTDKGSCWVTSHTHVQSFDSQKYCYVILTMSMAKCNWISVGHSDTICPSSQVHLTKKIEQVLQKFGFYIRPQTFLFITYGVSCGVFNKAFADFNHFFVTVHL